ncbi:hypothetical protein SAMN05518846_110153 [Brevibacillus centrosporus]|uniref:Transmembrane protein n=1 Tax=Brevibacillus centrosporus TaxID=54910 RepID=A0A1I3XZC6_9BACL|nr:hypothetical protein SAMN05518846_110153 [Brevibacillus centrosporus]
MEDSLSGSVEKRNRVQKQPTLDAFARWTLTVPLLALHLGGVPNTSAFFFFFLACLSLCGCLIVEEGGKKLRLVGTLLGRFTVRFRSKEEPRPKAACSGRVRTLDADCSSFGTSPPTNKNPLTRFASGFAPSKTTSMSNTAQAV